MGQQVVINEAKSPNIILRFLWFLLAGWYIGIGVLILSAICAVTVIGIPITFFLVDRLPTIMTLKARSRELEVFEDSKGKLESRRVSPKQTNIVLRVLYFIFIGWWLSALWTLLAVLCHLSIIGSPIAFVMVDRIPRIATLAKL